MSTSQSSAPVSIHAHQLVKSFGLPSVPGLDDVSLHVPPGHLTAILGPSGSGKTTLLRVLAGLERTDRGTVYFGSTDVTNQPARLRGVGFVFQQYALFRHLSVFENIAFPLRVRRWPRRAVRSRVDELLALIQLEGLGARRIATLSGGQAQRVALARALAPSPAVLLLDEPFSALDQDVRATLRHWLRNLHDQLRVTSVLVTHDRDDVRAVADSVVFMDRGRVQQAGSVRDLLHGPLNRAIAARPNLASTSAASESDNPDSSTAHYAISQ